MRNKSSHGCQGRLDIPSMLIDLIFIMKSNGTEKEKLFDWIDAIWDDVKVGKEQS